MIHQLLLSNSFVCILPPAGNIRCIANCLVTGVFITSIIKQRISTKDKGRGGGVMTKGITLTQSKFQFKTIVTINWKYKQLFHQFCRSYQLVIIRYEKD